MKQRATLILFLFLFFSSYRSISAQACTIAFNQNGNSISPFISTANLSVTFNLNVPVVAGPFSQTSYKMFFDNISTSTSTPMDNLQSKGCMINSGTRIWKFSPGKYYVFVTTEAHFPALCPVDRNSALACSDSFDVIDPSLPTITPAPASTPTPTLVPGATNPPNNPPSPPSGTTCANFKLNIGTYELCSPIAFIDFGSIISSLLPYVFVIAGLILFGLLIKNGLTFLTSAGDPKKAEMAKGGVTAALVGFIIIIAAYWLTQILEFILGINILGGP